MNFRAQTCFPLMMYWVLSSVRISGTLETELNCIVAYSVCSFSPAPPMCIASTISPNLLQHQHQKENNYYREKLQPQKKNFNRMHPWPCQTIPARVVKIYRFINNKILLKIFINKHTIRSNNLDKISKFILFNKLLFI